MDSPAGEQKQTNTLTLLCSLDRKLIDLARMLAPQLAGNLTDEEFRSQGFMKILEPWGAKEVGQIAELLEGFSQPKTIRRDKFIDRTKLISIK